MGTWEKKDFWEKVAEGLRDEQIAAADDDVSQEDILAALRDATGDGFVAWIDVRAAYDRILSDR
jgi:hypothetical protein